MIAALKVEESVAAGDGDGPSDGTTRPGLDKSAWRQRRRPHSPVGMRPTRAARSVHERWRAGDADERLLSRPLEDCEGCPRACWGSQSRSGRSQRRLSRFTCNSGDRHIRACRVAAALSQFPQAGRTGDCSPPTQSRHDHTGRLIGAVYSGWRPPFDPHDDDWGSTLTAKRCEDYWTCTGGRAWTSMNAAVRRNRLCR